MKINRILFPVITALCVIFTSCSKDEPPVPQELPSITSALVHSAPGEATVSGTLLSDGGSAIREWGVCWSTKPEPTVDDNKVTVPVSGTSFSATLSGLDPMGVYHFRCFAVNDRGTAYGNELTFVSEDKELTAAEIPDPVFFALLLDACDQDQDGKLMASEVLGLREMTIEGGDIASLEGIDYLRSMEKFSCMKNKLTTLKVNLPLLTSLDCSANDLTSLDVKGCPRLTELFCYQNQLPTLDVSGMTALTLVDCEDNLLTSLNVDGCVNLVELSCNDNQLPALDVTGCTNLGDLIAYRNKLTELDLTHCVALESLRCTGNLLTALDVSGFTKLTTLKCASNVMTSLDISDCPLLEIIICSDNRLTELDVRNMSSLIYLECGENFLPSLDITGCETLVQLFCNNNQLTSLDVTGCEELYALVCHTNRLTTLDVSACPKLSWLGCDPNPSLTDIFVSEEQMGSIGDKPDWTKPENARYVTKQ